MGDSVYDLAQMVDPNNPDYIYGENPLSFGLQALIVDEMHDTNWAMFTIIKVLLACNERCIFFGVGDSDQVIHKENGADACFMRADFFKCEIGEPKPFELTETFRFGEAISKPLSKQYAKPYLTHAASVVRTQVRIKRVDSAVDLFAVIHETLGYKSTHSLPRATTQVAVLLRNPSAATAVELEHALLERDVGYATEGFVTFLERPEVLFVRMILSAAVGQLDHYSSYIFSSAKEATSQFISGGQAYLPEIGIQAPVLTEVNLTSVGQKNFFTHILPAMVRCTQNSDAKNRVAAAMKLAQTDKISQLPDAIKTLGISQLAKRVFVKKESIDAAEESLRGLVIAANRYSTITQFLDAMIKFDYKRLRSKAISKRIRLSTIEDAKGLEFDHAIIPSMNKNSFDGLHNEDRNLFYVAASRAKFILTLAHDKTSQSSYLDYFRIEENF
jgi:DNA helicase II / ATP-dependent DNA helicase PcrA